MEKFSLILWEIIHSADSYRERKQEGYAPFTDQLSSIGDCCQGEKVKKGKYNRLLILLQDFINFTAETVEA